MRPTFNQLLPLIMLSSVALGSPVRAQAQEARVVTGAAVATPTPGGTVESIQWQAPYGRDDRDNGWGSGRDRAEFIARDRGYRIGYASGADDARDGRRFDPRRHRALRDADFRGGYGDDRRYDGLGFRVEEGFRRGFLSGYDAGYRDAHRRYDSREYRWGRDRDDRWYPSRRW